MQIRASIQSSAAARAAVALLALLATAARPIGAQVADLARILDSTRLATKMPAMAAAIVTRDSILAYAAVGVRKRDDPTPVTRDDRFAIGSNTKAMTAGLIGLLVDERRVTWSATLAELFPELAARMRAEYREVTLRDLLTHHSGLVRDVSGDFDRRTGREQRERFVPWVLTQKPASARGTFMYSNCNYILLGAIAERLTGVDYEMLVAQRLLAPLGVARVGFGPPASPGVVDQPWGHSEGFLDRWHSVAPEQQGSDFPPLYAPAGQLNLSVRDWARWAQVVMRAASGAPSPWKHETAAALFTPPVPADSVAMGWWVLNRKWATPGGRILMHDGSNGRFFSIAVLAPEAGFGILVMTNRGGPNGAAAITTLTNRLRTEYTSGGH